MSTTTWSTITPEELQHRTTETDVLLIDVRTPAEFQEVHVPFAQNYPLDRLKPEEVQSLLTNENQIIYLICKSGTRGKMACEKLVAANVLNVVNVEGGTSAWDNAGLPVVRGKSVISLERQVRIAAGFLVLTGTILGFFLHLGFLGIPAFVGAGLMFAGITDTCGMGMILARMPWNQVSSDTSKQKTQCTP